MSENSITTRRPPTRRILWMRRTRILLMTRPGKKFGRGRMVRNDGSVVYGLGFGMLMITRGVHRIKVDQPVFRKS